MEAMETGRKELIDEQISFIVHGFISVWNEFEDALARELSADNRKERDSRLNTSYEMVYRVGNSLVERGLSMGELSTALSVPLSTATRVVDMMVEEGFVRRLPDPSDRRVVRVAFTERGRELYNRMDSYITARVRKIAAYLNEDEMETLLGLLNKVASAIKQVPG